MPNPRPKTKHLPKQQTQWQHLPTKAIRVPALLSDRLLQIAKVLDRYQEPPAHALIGAELEFIQLVEQLHTLSIDELTQLQQALPLILEQKFHDQSRC
ncbi:hypothetical protein H6F67_20760 [Microcoleus sp. FACHB-1515]|uniref:hypothetical protein n=1 Tax=Cyanophyceae TaxID=3028117 RepID=UPI00168553FF|nr:hypothetical protein [Microcoleus sp. FACHB-1515]MBD2092284.1 hypothetical protein [Microcoleus sp. FACHB-1515]